MKNVVPFRAPAKFAEYDIDWTRAARTEPERRLREAFLTYETEVERERSRFERRIDLIFFGDLYLCSVHWYFTARLGPG